MDAKTKKPNKQRKRMYQSALNKKRKLLVATIDKNIQKEVNKKSIAIRKGDTVKVMVGNHKGKSGKVEVVDYTKVKVYIKDIKTKNTRGQEKLIPFTASNLMLTNVILDDSKRIKEKKTKTPKVDN